MKTKTLTIGKEIKKGLPNYSNITVSMHLEIEVGEQETLTNQNYLELWDKINKQLAIQLDVGEDPSWMTNTKEHKDFYTTTIKTPKSELPF